MSATGRWRIGVDIGGTFTDFVLADAATGRVHNEKLLTTPHDPSRAVLEGIRRLLDAHRVAPADVALVIHGTTLVANALIERKGVRTALVTTRGFRDVLEIGLEWRYDTYDLGLEMPPPLAPRATSTTDASSSGSSTEPSAPSRSPTSKRSARGASGGGISSPRS